MTKYKIIKDCDGNLLYKKKVYEEYRQLQIDGQINRDESLVDDWKASTTNHILRRIDRNFSPYSQYRKQYKCAHCSFTGSCVWTVKDHLSVNHSINTDINGSGKCCHACRKNYNKLFEAKKYAGWSDDRRREHHWKKCEKIQERIKSYIAVESSTYVDVMFDTTKLPLNIRHKISDSFSRKYISDKHVYHECKPEYIDNITTAYRSDVMKEIIAHNN